MNDYDLKYFKKHFGKWKNVMINYNHLKSKRINLKSEIKELEENELIQKYLKKKEQLDSLNDRITQIRRENGREFLFDENKALIQYGFNINTNKIYVCLGGYPKRRIVSDDMQIKSEPDMDKYLPIESNEAVYRIYADIESNDTEVIAKIEWNEFENDNTVLFPGKEEPFEFFRRVRLLFFKNCIENTQEEAIAKVLELKK